MPKRKGKHCEKQLSAVGIRSLPPGRHIDGNGLYLIVEPNGAKRWILRVVAHGKRREIGLGGLSDVSLAEARESAQKYRKIAHQGGDPVAACRKDRKPEKVPTFAEAAKELHIERKASWENPKHADQWINTLTAYVFPVFGDKRIDLIDSADILKTLTPIWLTKAETARRVRQRIGTVMDWAKAKGYRSGDNPVTGIREVLPKQADRDDDAHHAALPYANVPEFIRMLKTANVGEIVKLAFEFLILTAARTGEVIHAHWAEFDLSNAVWEIPSNRMKTKRKHRVPLSPRSIAILNRVRELSEGSEYVFPGRTEGKPLSNMAFLMALRRMNRPITAHGFRSSFRDWAAERTNFAREVCEAALAHTIDNKVEAAYRRGDLFDKRRDLMATWAAFVTSAQAEVRALRA
jgi:integrase